MVKDKTKTFTKKLKVPGGKFPADDPKTFKLLFEIICNDFGLTKATDQIIANSLASCIMRKKYCEELIKKYGLFVTNEDESQIVKMNPLAYYLRDLGAEITKYTRMLRESGKGIESETPKDFVDMINNG